MCGIFFTVFCAKCDQLPYDKIAATCRSQLQRRGPDVYNEIPTQVSGKYCRLIGAVLWMQGSVPTSQPISDIHGNQLLWNGEIFNDERPRDISDTAYLSSLLSNTSNSTEVISVIASLRGPFSLVYVEHERARVWFARDRIGRHSLLFRRDGAGLAISSVGGATGGWTEVPTAGLYCVDLAAEDLSLVLHPWTDLESDPESILGATISDIVIQSPLTATTESTPLEETDREEYSQLLSRIYAVSIPQQHLTKTTSIPHHETIPSSVESNSILIDQAKDGVCFKDDHKLETNKKLNNQISDDTKSLDKVQISTQAELLSNTNISLCDETPSQQDEELFTNLKLNCQLDGKEPSALALLSALGDVPRVRERADRLEKLLSKAVRRRVEAQPGLCSKCVGRRTGSCNHAKIGILFSGGLDSSVLAALADRWVPAGEPIELINVSFERVRNTTHRNDRVGQAAQCVDTPDRVTGKQTLTELRAAYPDRCWRFLEVNVPRAEMCERLADTVSHLIRPRVSVLDESLGLAVWFAARGVGNLDPASAAAFSLDSVATELVSLDSEINIPPTSKDSGVPDSQRADAWDGHSQYLCSARVLLMGTGADEQLGGYQRHRKTLASAGWVGLAAAMRGDLARLPARNLGRDDRCAADSGRTPRHPFLDEDVVTFLACLPVAHRSWLTSSLPAGVGDKYLLRLVALRLGLRDACTFPKRAMQFGSRAADPRQRGDDPSGSLVSPGMSQGRGIAFSVCMPSNLNTLLSIPITL